LEVIAVRSMTPSKLRSSQRGTSRVETLVCDYCGAALAQDPVRAATFYQVTEIQFGRGRLAEAESAVLLAKGDHDAALIERERVNVVDGRQLGRAPI
jgi:hypothetical protein